jgi:hypothetical protein
MSADEIPLHAQVMIEPFNKWSLDFVRPISPMSYKKNYILVCTDYVIQWVEEKSLFRATKKSIFEFIYEDILPALVFLVKLLQTKALNSLPS